MPLDARERDCRRARPAVPDRDLQDWIIRYLTDAHTRPTYKNLEYLDEQQAQRAQRFSHFLMRRYYRDRLHRGFHYAERRLADSSLVDGIASSREFDRIIESSTLGSAATARDVGRLAIAQLLPLGHEPWWSELLKYEFAFFLQLAISETTDPDPWVKKSVSAMIDRFSLRIPDLLLRLKSGEISEIDLAGEAILLFSRTPHGKIYIVELDEVAAHVFTAIDGKSSTAQIAHACALSREEIERILVTLSDIGAVVLPASRLAPAV